MERIIRAHLYASGSFVATKCSYTYMYRVALIGLYGVPEAFLAYLCTVLFMCRRDPALRVSLLTLARLFWNRGQSMLGFESKNKHKKVGGKMRRPAKKDE
jgi:hypothetical protein